MSLNVEIKKAWNGFSLNVAFKTSGERLGILGASGCGKSLTLKCIAGIETPSCGKIALNDKLFFDSSKKINVRPQLRGIGYLFQSYALFPHMTIEENIYCALRSRDANAKALVADMTRRFRLDGLGKRFPDQLSGGQQQRAALCRILAGSPDALLLDEPFSALDYHLKEQLQAELMSILEEYRGDVLLVTHSRDEVYRFCEKLLVIDNGKEIAFGDTKELFKNPRHATVASLTGCKNISRAVKSGDYSVFALDWDIELIASERPPDDIDFVGVRAHSFYPCVEGGINAFEIAVREVMESPFETNTLISKSGSEMPQPIWWAHRKGTETPARLAVLPEDVLLLHSH